MKPKVILLVTLAVLTVVAAQPLGEFEALWPCCDDCGPCNRKFPPECQCNDISVYGCHPECKKCVRNAFPTGDDGKHPGWGHGPVVTYRCADMLTNFCKRHCLPPVQEVFPDGVF